MRNARDGQVYDSELVTDYRLGMDDLERAWRDLEDVCARSLGLPFHAVDLGPMRAVMDIPAELGALWEKRYPVRAIKVDELLFASPQAVAKLVEDRYQGDWPHGWTLLSDPGAGHFSYQLVRGQVALVSDEEPWWDDVEADGSVKAPSLAYPSLAAFLTAVANTLSLTPEAAFEVRWTKRWLRANRRVHLRDEVCRRLRDTWPYPGFPPVVLRASVGDTPLSDVVCPPVYADLFREH